MDDPLPGYQERGSLFQSELNVRDVLFTLDETLSGVRYKAVADWSILGKKLRKDLTKA